MDRDRTLPPGMGAGTEGENPGTPSPGDGKRTELISAEKGPRDILERYRAIYDRSLVCLYVHDLEGNFLDANETALKMLGYEREDIFSMNLASFLNQDQLQEAYDTLQEILRTGKQEALSRYELRKKDGSVVWMETEGSLLFRGREPYAIQGIARDITDRERMEKSLRQSEENFRSLAENANDGILIAAFRGNHIFANRAAAEVLGYRSEELLGTTLKDIVHPKDLQWQEDRRMRRIQGEDLPERYEVRFVSRDGEVVPVELTASRIFWHGQDATQIIFRDISERKEAEEVLRKSMESLRESEAKFRSLFDLSPQAVAVTEEETGNLVNVNDKFCELTGYGMEDILGRSTLELGMYSEADRKRVLRVLNESGEVNGLEMDFRICGGYTARPAANPWWIASNALAS